MSPPIHHRGWQQKRHESHKCAAHSCGINLLHDCVTALHILNFAKDIKQIASYNKLYLFFLFAQFCNMFATSIPQGCSFFDGLNWWSSTGSEPPNCRPRTAPRPRSPLGPPAEWPQRHAAWRGSAGHSWGQTIFWRENGLIFADFC